jgi:hypothetical protein
MLYGVLIMGAAGAGERKFPGLVGRGAAGDLLGREQPALLPEQQQRIGPYRYV